MKMTQLHTAAFSLGLALATAHFAPAAPQPAAGSKKLKVFVLAGQSNMQGQANVSTFDVIGLDPKTAPLLAEMRNPDGTPRVCEHVWVSSIGCGKEPQEEQTGKLTAGFGAAKRGPKIGPEFTFGIYLQKQIDPPILLIKTSWGGKSLSTDFRPPSAGPYPFREEQLKQFQQQGKDIDKIKADKAAATGRYYRTMIEHVKKVLADPKRVCPDYDPQQGWELAGFVWFQGWNDLVDADTYPNRSKPGGYDQYSKVLADFIRDVRKDLSAPALPFVIGVMGVGGPIEKYPPDKQRYVPMNAEFRKAMAAPAALPEFQGNVAAVFTEQFWDLELDALLAKNGKLQGEVDGMIKEGKLAAAERNAAIEQRRAAAFTPRERELLAKGASDAGFHYLGSAKILGQIGKAFAEAMVDLTRNRPKN
jgi:hypothetical protein